MLDLKCAVCLKESRVEGHVVSELVDVVCPACGTHLRLVVVPLGLMPGYDARQYTMSTGNPAQDGLIVGQEIVK